MNETMVGMLLPVWILLAGLSVGLISLFTIPRKTERPSAAQLPGTRAPSI